VAGIHLPRSGNLLFRLGQHLVPLRQPSGRARNGEHDGEHLRTETHRLVDDSGVEVHVGIQFALDEVIVFQGDAFQFQSDVKSGIAAGAFEHLFGGPLDDASAGIVILVNAMSESHQLAVSFFDSLDVGRHFIFGSDCVQHAEHRFVGAAMKRPSQRRGRRCSSEEGIGQRAAHASHGIGAAVLFMVGVEDEEYVQSARQHGIGDVLGFHHLPQHVHEVFRIGQVVVGINVGESEAMTVAVGRDGWNLADQAQNLMASNGWVVNLACLRLNCGKRGYRADEHSHRVRVVAEALQELLGSFVQHGVVSDLEDPFF